MDLAREEVYAFVFRPLSGAGAYLSGFTGDCKDTNGYFARGKIHRGEISVQGIPISLECGGFHSPDNRVLDTKTCNNRDCIHI